ncbi:hypothetical protein EV2_019736 [Malus domestica]
MGEKRRRTVSLKIGRSSAGVRPPENQSGEALRRRRHVRCTCCAWPARGPVPRVARGASKIFSENFSTLVTSSETYPEDDRIQGRHGGYDPSTYQF